MSSNIDLVFQTLEDDNVESKPAEDVARFNTEQKIWAEGFVDGMIKNGGLETKSFRVVTQDWWGFKIQLVYVDGARYHYNPFKKQVHCVLG